jgi:hypothetical protein
MKGKVWGMPFEVTKTAPVLNNKPMDQIDVHNEIDEIIEAGPAGTIEQQNHDYCNETLKLKVSLELHFLEMGKRLLEIRDNRLYQPAWETFTEYLMEMKWDRSRANRIINIYKIFVVQYQIAPARLAAAGGWSILAELLPVAIDKEQAEEWVDKAALHPQQELRQEIREARGMRSVRQDPLSDIEGDIAIQRSNGQWCGAIIIMDEATDQPIEAWKYDGAETLNDLVYQLKQGKDE